MAQGSGAFGALVVRRTLECSATSSVGCHGDRARSMDDSKGVIVLPYVLPCQHGRALHTWNTADARGTFDSHFVTQ